MVEEEKNLSDNTPEISKDKLKSKLQPHSFPEFVTNKATSNGDYKFSPANKTLEMSDKTQNENKTKPWPKPETNQGENEIDLLIAKAQQDGFELGFKEGRAQEKKRVDNLENTISAAISDLEDFKSELLVKAEKSIINIVSEISKKIILSEPTFNPELIIEVVKSALKMVIDFSNLKIKVNQDDLNILIENKNSLEEILGNSTTVRIESDPNVSIGGCIIETDFGDFDARLENQLKIIIKSLESQFDLNSKKTVA